MVMLLERHHLLPIPRDGSHNRGDRSCQLGTTLTAHD
jgi:hypothetical protein